MAVNSGHKVYWPSTTDPTLCESNNAACISAAESYQYQRSMPGWGVPVVAAITLALSIPLYYLFEEPMRKLIQVK